MNDNNVAWSPDGKNLAFRTIDNGSPDILLMDADGSEPLINLTKDSADDQLPVFSPDGTKIAFTKVLDANFEIFVMNANGSGTPTNLTNSSSADAWPEFSPNGKRLAFASNHPFKDPTTGAITSDIDIHVMDLFYDASGAVTGTSSPTNLTDDMVGTTGSTNERWPAWPPDGQRIAFWSGSGSGGGADAEIYTMNSADGSNKVNLTKNENPANEISPDWGADNTPPTITLTTPAEGVSYTLYQSVAAAYDCADEGGSGLASCAGDVPSGDPIDTASVGSKTFAVTAKDIGGNTSSVSRAYSVIYDFYGFSSPVDNPPTLNLARAGSAIPVNFGLSGDQGLGILADGYPASRKTDCDPGAPEDPVEETLSANQSGLIYDASSDLYTYAWKTNKAWAGSCRRLVVKLDDGTEHPADFEFK